MGSTDRTEVYAPLSGASAPTSLDSRRRVSHFDHDYKWAGFFRCVLNSALGDSESQLETGIGDEDSLRATVLWTNDRNQCRLAPFMDLIVSSFFL